MPAHARTAAQRDVQRGLIIRGVAQGKTHAELALEFGVDRSQVSKDWARAKAEHVRQVAEDFRGYVADKLLKLDMAAELALQCWLATMQPTTEQEWIGPAPLSEDDAEKLATIADADEEVAKALREVGAGHWRPKKLNPAKPSPSFALAYAAITRLQLETVGALQARAKNEGRELEPGSEAIPQASRVTELEAASRALEKLEGLTGGRMLKFKRAG